MAERTKLEAAANLVWCYCETALTLPEGQRARVPSPNRAWTHPLHGPDPTPTPPGTHTLPLKRPPRSALRAPLCRPPAARAEPPETAVPPAPTVISNPAPLRNSQRRLRAVVSPLWAAIKGRDAKFPGDSATSPALRSLSGHIIAVRANLHRTAKLDSVCPR
jgi:hypothetical protein